jgi:hypothetical protein
MQTWLSSHMIDGSSLDSLLEWYLCSNLRVVMLFVDRLFIFSELGNNPYESMSFSVLRIGSRALQHWLSAMYSASVELSAISVCSLLNQCMGTPARTMMNHVRDKHASRICANYWCLTPSKLLLQYASSERFLFGFMMIGLSIVHCKYYMIPLTAFSCSAFGSFENRAHWWNANDMSGREFCAR